MASIAGASTNLTNPTNAGNSENFLASIIPGYKNLVGGTTDIINNLLQGSPSPSTVRNANAAFGVSSGQPAIGGVGTFAGNRGFDLYRQQGQQNQQTGIGNLLGLISGVSSPALANQGQQLQNSQFNANLGQQASQFNTNMQLQNFLAQLQALGLGNSIVSSNPSRYSFNL